MGGRGLNRESGERIVGREGLGSEGSVSDMMEKLPRKLGKQSVQNYSGATRFQKA